MGYRSDVTIRCEERAFQEFKTAWEKVDFKPSTILKACEDGKYTYILEWEWVKWYRDFEDVKKIMNVCRTLDGKMKMDMLINSSGLARITQQKNLEMKSDLMNF